MAPAAPVIAGKPAPTETEGTRNQRHTCGSGFTREAGDAIHGTGCAGDRRQASSHRNRPQAPSEASTLCSLPRVVSVQACMGSRSSSVISPSTCNAALITAGLGSAKAIFIHGSN